MYQWHWWKSQAQYHRVIQTKILMIIYHLVGECTNIWRQESATEIQQNDCIIRVVIYSTNHHSHISQYLWFWGFTLLCSLWLLLQLMLCKRQNDQHLMYLHSNHLKNCNSILMVDKFRTVELSWLIYQINNWINNLIKSDTWILVTKLVR